MGRAGEAGGSRTETENAGPELAGSTRRSARPRVRRGTISRAQIVEAALRSVATTGFEQMTIRSLAAELGVAPMSLYRYIRDKDDLMDDVVEELLRRSHPMPPGRGTWQVRITAAADALRHLLVTEPAALHVYLRHPVVSPQAVRRMDMMLHVLQEAGFDDEQSRAAYAAVQTFTIGFAALEASRAGWKAEMDTELLALELASFATPAQFARGLRYLLEGIEHDADIVSQKS